MFILASRLRGHNNSAFPLDLNRVFACLAYLDAAVAVDHKSHAPQLAGDDEFGGGSRHSEDHVIIDWCEAVFLGVVVQNLAYLPGGVGDRFALPLIFLRLWTLAF